MHNMQYTICNKKNIFSVVELGILLVLLPWLMLHAPFHVPRLPLLLLGCGYCIWRLSGKVSLKRSFTRPPKAWWRAPVLRATCLLLLTTAYMLYTEPDKMFALPRYQPVLWVLIMCLYPVISVLPQEIIYRVYIFEVHAKEKPCMWLLPSAALFGWVHIIYSGYFAVFAAALAGLPLGWNYLHNRQHPGALWPLLLEHALYGQIVFTVGLGRHFYVAG